ncbi:MAG: LruC domain-containing protein [Planctomycetota bacterium]|jgi:LruC domain-containing protein
MNRATMFAVLGILLATAKANLTETTTFVDVPPSLLDTVGDILPERSHAGAAYVSETYSPNLLVSDACQVFVTFVWEGAGYRNSLGYFTFRDEPDGSVTILSRGIIWDDVSFPSQGSMTTGDTTVLRDENGDPRTFASGEKVGFFVVADGYNTEPLIRDWAAGDASPAIPAATPAGNEDWGRGCYTTIERLNPEFQGGSTELARHVAMVRMDGISGFLDGEPFLLTGFEDLNRAASSDDDFNDCVFIVSSNPISAIGTSEVFVYAEGDPDNDGVSGTDDHFPNDSSRTLTTRFPDSGFHVLGYEDSYPSRGDADYNDAVVAYVFETVTDAAGDVKDVLATFHLVARGAGFDSRFGLHMPGIPESATGTVRLQRFLSGGAVESPPDRTITFLRTTGQRRIADLFPSTKAALPPASGSAFTNTSTTQLERNAASVRLHIEFDAAVSASALGVAPYDVYFATIRGDGERDVHLPGRPAFSDRPSGLPAESGADSFLDDQGFPWVIRIPTDFRFPLEKVRISTAYPRFDAWRTTTGSQDADWYTNPGSANVLSSQLAAYIPARAWTVTLPAR